MYAEYGLDGKWKSGYTHSCNPPAGAKVERRDDAYFYMMSNGTNTIIATVERPEPSKPYTPVGSAVSYHNYVPIEEYRDGLYLTSLALESLISSTQNLETCTEGRRRIIQNKLGLLPNDVPLGQEGYYQFYVSKMRESTNDALLLQYYLLNNRYVQYNVELTAVLEEAVYSGTILDSDTCAQLLQMFVGTSDYKKSISKSTARRNRMLDALQTGLDFIGSAPVFGEPVDVVNGVISFARGDKASGFISLASAAPFLSSIAPFAKAANKVDNYADVLKYADEVYAGVGEVKAELPGRNGALNQAKRDANILRNQKPDYIEKVKMTEAESRGGHVVKDANGNVIETREYHYTNRFGEEVVIQEHSAPHVGSEGPHFNVRPITDTRNGVFPGTKEHYPYKKK